jgi:hypothetical protein
MTAESVEGAEAKKSAPTVTIPSVSSTGQRSGVTAGYVGELNQTVLPSLVRGPQLEKFKSTFTEGSKLYREFNNRPISDPQIDNLCERTQAWADATFQWLHSHVSEYAAERYLFRPPGLSYSYNLPGDHASGYTDRWGNCRTALSELLVNLDRLMRDPSIYPEPAGD